jgi:hypothetical protein
VNQELAGYSPVAGKDTLVRVFVGVGPDLEVTTFPLSLDRAELDVKNMTNGSVFTVTSAFINNPITNFNKQYSERNNVNFYLDGSTLPAGDYEFTARLYSNSRTPIREFDFGTTYLFTATPPLRLLIVFGDDPDTGLDDLGKDPDLRKDLVLWDYIQQDILPTISRIYPISSGVGTIDVSADCTGDHTSGLRYSVFPGTINANNWWDGNQVLKMFNLMLKRPVPCEQADKVTMFIRNRGYCSTDDRKSCMGNYFSEGVEGGSGELPGSASGVWLALNSRDTGKGAGNAGWMLAQELGHNYGLVDRTEPNYSQQYPGHSKNYCIDDQSAFNLLGRNSIRGPSRSFYPGDHHGISVMEGKWCGFQDTALDELALLEVVDWNFLRDKLALSPITVTSTAPVFYIVGTINPDDTVQLLDSRLLPPGSPTDPPIDSPYTIVILNANGQKLASSSFGYSVELPDGPDKVAGLPSIVGKPFSVAQPFPLGGAEVQLRHNQNVIARLRRSVNPPIAALLAPGGGEVFGPGNRQMVVRWNGSDPDGDPLTYSLSFSSDGGQTFLPIGTVFGPKTTSYVWNTSFSPRATKQGVIRIEASDGFNVASASSKFFTIEPTFAGTPGKGNCNRLSITKLLLTYGTLDDAPAALGYPSVAALDDAITAFCGGADNANDGQNRLGQGRRYDQRGG